uniref:Uncharacterized protein n=1 Tax=Tanacetum cinerariifolium TaxID=118510 RepID=A0A699JMF3_TANCI|nr:hypothetical protein [Tanacetum cinerariifolium]GFA80545.1 hypothetical protein [Tanacetum cinerariifolium]
MCHTVAGKITDTTIDSISYPQSLIHKHRLMFEICTMNQKLKQEHVPTLNEQRARMFLETVHICSNDFDEKA